MKSVLDKHSATTPGIPNVKVRPAGGTTANGKTGQKHGVAADTAGRLYVETAAVGATAHKYLGMAYTPDGALHVSDSAPGAGAVYHQGFAFSSTGALHIDSGAAAATDRVWHGLRFNGFRLRMSVTL